MVSLSFSDILVFGTPILTAIFTYLLLKRGEEGELRIVKEQDKLRYVHYFLLFALLMITVYSVYLGHRPLAYFFIVAALFVTSVLYGMGSNERKHSKMSFLTALILAGSISIALIVGNRFYPTYRWEHDSILQTGSLKEHQEGVMKSGLYYYVPIESLIKVTIALIIGPSQFVSLIYWTSMLIATVAGLFALLRRLCLKSVTGTIGVFFFLSIQALSFPGRCLHLPYTMFYILLIRLLYESPSAAIGHFIVSLPMIFAHPLGFVTVIALLSPLALLRINNWPAKGMNSRGITLSLITTIVVTFAYWIHTYLLTSMMQEEVKFYLTISSYFSGVIAEGSAEPGYTPRYYYEGYEIFAYAWSIPAALSAALLISMVLQFIRERRFDWSRSFTLTSAFMGALIVFLAYLPYLKGEAEGQYLIPAGYFLLLLSTSVTATELLTIGSKKYAYLQIIIAIGLLSSFVLVGTYSPDWAPLEHPDFKASDKVHPYRVYIEVGTAKLLIPADAIIYSDYDFPLGSSGKLPESIISRIRSGISPTRFARLLFCIRNEGFLGGFVNWHVVYSNGYHIIVAIS